MLLEILTGLLQSRPKDSCLDGSMVGGIARDMNPADLPVGLLPDCCWQELEDRRKVDTVQVAEGFSQETPHERNLKNLLPTLAAIG